MEMDQKKETEGVHMREESTIFHQDKIPDNGVRELGETTKLVCYRPSNGTGPLDIEKRQ